ncbi:hypothetical protein PAHAL_8G171400 [Panicum hallii]|nr:hypothetical protein PAHAL_8G171400 [Panicum hallii]
MWLGLFRLCCLSPSINTLYQSFFGTHLPAVIDGSYTAVVPTISPILKYQHTQNRCARLLSSDDNGSMNGLLS